MRITLFLAIIALAFTACQKDKYQTVPKIKFNSMTPNTVLQGTSNSNGGPFLSIQLTDAEGDFGFSAGEDTSYVYLKNITVPPFNVDSLPFPSSSSIKRKDLNAEVVVNLFDAAGIVTGTPGPNHIDTLYFEVYVKDFAKNKSNVITTEPVYFITP